MNNIFVYFFFQNENTAMHLLDSHELIGMYRSSKININSMRYAIWPLRINVEWRMLLENNSKFFPCTYRRTQAHAYLAAFEWRYGVGDGRESI